MLEQLLKYQEIDREVRKIEIDLAGSEERRRALGAKNFLLEGEDNAGKLDRRAKDLSAQYENLKLGYEKQLKTVEEYEQAFEGSADDADELSYLAKKINQLSDTLRRIESELGDVMRDMEDTVKSYGDFRHKFNQTKDEYLVYRKKYEDLKTAKQSELEPLKKQLADLSKKIDPERLKRYTIRRNDKIFPVLVPLENERCGGCRMELPLSERGKLKADSPIECENCKRIIYLP